MTFGAPQWLWALLALPALGLIFLNAEQRGAERLRHFVSPRLLGQLGATVSRGRRAFRFILLLVSLALALVSLAKPRWGYTYEEVKRKGLDLLVAIDTSRSMLANDVPPNRLQRVKLSAQDLIHELRGDRIGLIAFAGRAFLQAPLTIDYDAAIESLNEFDTNIIPEGGTNISDAIGLAVKTFGKSAVGNRALIIFTDGEELAGDAVKIAKMAADSGVRIFTVGVGTPEGSLIPLQGSGGGTSFVKDNGGQIVKSKLDEKRLREIAESTDGFYVGLTSGPSAMQQLYNDGLAKMQAADIDARASRQPIERYQWPLGAALLALTAAILMSERKVMRRRARVPAARPAAKTVAAAAAAAVVLLVPKLLLGAAPGLDEYRGENFPEAYKRFEQTLEAHPDTHATDKIQFDAGAAAYKMKDYNKALESFSQALLSKDVKLQSESHYNLGNTLYQRGEAQKKPDDKLKDWSNALQHYEQTLKIEPENKEAKENYDYVKNKIDELKKQQEQQPTPTPTPSPSPSPQKNDKNQQDKNQQKSQDKDKQQKEQQKDQQQQQDQSDSDQKSKDQQQKAGQSPSPSPQPGESPTPSPSPGEASPSPSPGDQQGASPTPGENGASPSPSAGENEQAGASPTPTPGEGQGEGEDQNATPSPTPAATPQNKGGDVKGANQDQPPSEAEEAEEAEQTDENQMSAQQAERLLRAMRDEEAKVQLDERKALRRVLKDW